MTDQDALPPEDPAALAAEHALGLLDPDQSREAERRIARDPAFAALVRAWTERLAPLAEEATPASPPPELWSRIERRLGGAPFAANDNVRALRVWRRIALGASGLAAASLAAVVLLLARPPQAATQVATLAASEGGTVLVAAFDPKTGALLVTPGPALHASGHTPHLWLLKPGGGVQLVGAIDPVRAATHNLPHELAREASSARGLALSLEPAGHKPIASPGGPVVGAGDFTEL